MNWQPIESAPKDGTVIGVVSAKERGVIRLVRWARHLDGPNSPFAWCTVTKGISVTNMPTHWILIDAPPATTGEPG